MTETMLQPQIPEVVFQVRPVPKQAQVVVDAGLDAKTIALQVKQVQTPPTTNMIEVLPHLHAPAAEFHIKALLKQMQLVALSLDKAQITVVQPMQVLLGRRTKVEAQTTGAPHVLLLRIIKGEAQPHAVPCQLRLPRQMHTLLVVFIPLEQMVLLQTTQVAVVPAPTITAEELEQIQPVLGDQTNKALMQVQTVDVSELTAYIVELQRTQLQTPAVDENMTELAGQLH